MRRPCSTCGRPVVVRTRRGWRSPDADHDQCRACWQSARDAARAEAEPPTDEVPMGGVPVEGLAEAVTAAMFGFPAGDDGEDTDVDEDEGRAA